MSLFRKRPAILILTLIAAAACRPSNLGRRAELVEALLAGLIAEREPGAAVLVAHDGSVLLERCRGVAELRTRRKIGSRTNFRLASVSKAFTAAAVMLLVHDGRLRYEDTL